MLRLWMQTQETLSHQPNLCGHTSQAEAMTTSYCQTLTTLTCIETQQPSGLVFSHVTKRSLNVDRAINEYGASRDAAFSLVE